MPRMKLLVFISLLFLTLPVFSESVVVDDKQWLQPRYFRSYTWDDVNKICPAGNCVGSLPGSRYDISGCTWASLRDVSELMQAYIQQPSFGPGPDSYAEKDSTWAPQFLDELRLTWADVGDNCVEGMTRDRQNDQVQTGGMVCVNYTAGDDLAILYSRSNYGGNRPDASIGQWFFCPVDLTVPENTAFEVRLEEPIDGGVHSGIGNIRGWAIAEEGIDRIEILIDGVTSFAVPFGGSRSDVAEVFPWFPNTYESGFAMAYGYSNLSPGPHTITARAYTNTGEIQDSTAAFTVVSFHKKYLNPAEGVDFDGATVDLPLEQKDEIQLYNVEIDGKRYNITLKWRPYSQGFETTEIKEVPYFP